MALQTQSATSSLPGGEIELLGHNKHGATPVPTLYVFLTHCVHMLFCKKLPAGQVVRVGAHGPPLGPVVWHMQSINCVLPINERESLGQFEHSAAQVFALYVFMGQLHGPPFDPGMPDLQIHFACVSLPAIDSEPHGHVVHSSTPVLDLYVSTGHN